MRANSETFPSVVLVAVGARPVAAAVQEAGLSARRLRDSASKPPRGAVSQRGCALRGGLLVLLCPLL